MTLQETLAACDRMKPNACPEQEKRRWLSELDGRIYRELLACHEGAPETFSGYDMQTAGGTELLVPDRYAELYLYYLSAQIDFVNAEFVRYNNAAALYNTAYEAFANAYHREHRPLQTHTLKRGGLR